MGCLFSKAAQSGKDETNIAEVQKDQEEKKDRKPDRKRQFPKEGHKGKMYCILTDIEGKKFKAWLGNPCIERKSQWPKMKGVPNPEDDRETDLDLQEQGYGQKPQKPQKPQEPQEPQEQNPKFPKPVIAVGGQGGQGVQKMAISGTGFEVRNNGLVFMTTDESEAVDFVTNDVGVPDPEGTDYQHFIYAENTLGEEKMYLRSYGPNKNYKLFANEKEDDYRGIDQCRFLFPWSGEGLDLEGNPINLYRVQCKYPDAVEGLLWRLNWREGHIRCNGDITNPNHIIVEFAFENLRPPDF